MKKSYDLYFKIALSLLLVVSALCFLLPLAQLTIMKQDIALNLFDLIKISKSTAFVDKLMSDAAAGSELIGKYIDSISLNIPQLITDAVAKIDVYLIMLPIVSLCAVPAVWLLKKKLYLIPALVSVLINIVLIAILAPTLSSELAQIMAQLKEEIPLISLLFKGSMGFNDYAGSGLKLWITAAVFTVLTATAAFFVKPKEIVKKQNNNKKYKKKKRKK